MFYNERAYILGIILNTLCLIICVFIPNSIHVTTGCLIGWNFYLLFRRIALLSLSIRKCDKK